MEKLTDALNSPAVIIAILSVAVALISVIVQGIKAIIDTIIQVRNSELARTQKQMAYVSALLGFVDGLPIDGGQKFVLKGRIVKNYLPQGLPAEVKKEIDHILRL